MGTVGQGGPAAWPFKAGGETMRYLTVVGLVVLCVTQGLAGEMLCDFESLEGFKVAQQPATFAPAPDAHQGVGAIKVTMPGQVSAVIRADDPPEEWDKCAGVSFWAKGDGSSQWGSIAIGGTGSNHGYQYVYFFPLNSTEWQQHTVPWRDWVPEGPVDGIGQPGALPPCGIQSLRLGTRWNITHNNAKIPPHSYAVDEVELVATVPPPSPPHQPRPLKEVIAKLRDRGPLRIICMGDSITAGTGLKSADTERYAVVLQEKLRRAMDAPQITCESRAVGGARLTDARAWVRRDFQGEAPDLVTMLYGYNDKSGQWSTAQFAASLEDYIQRVADATGGKAAIVPIATIPGRGPRYSMMDNFAQVVRDVSGKMGLECCDMPERLKFQGREGLVQYMGDMAHPNAEGHVLMAQVLTDWLVAKAIGL